MNWWLFPPRTREVQLDEKWAFVGKKQCHCDASDPEDDHKGDYWDHVSLDLAQRLMLAVVPGARSIAGETTRLSVWKPPDYGCPVP